MNMEGKPAARPQDPLGFHGAAAPRLATADHAQGAEHRESIIECVIGKAVKPAEIGLNPRELDPGQFCLEADDAEHRPREVDGGDREAAAREPDRMPAGPATQVDQRAGRHEPPIERLLVGPE